MSSVLRSGVGWRRVPQVPHVAAAFLAVFALPGCENWPPEASDLVDNFFSNRKAFEELEERMAGTEYVRVSIAGAGGSDRVSLMWDTDEQVEDGRRRELQYVEDSTWFNLLQTARVFAVNRFDGVTSFDLGSSIAEGKRLVFAQYAHSSELLRSRKRCLPEYQDIDCGLCVVPLADGWYIEYWWSPENLAEHEEQRLLERQISEDEYLLAFDEKLRQCRLDGYSVIGYKSGQ